MLKISKQDRVHEHKSCIRAIASKLKVMFKNKVTFGKLA